MVRRTILLLFAGLLAIKLIMEVSGLQLIRTADSDIMLKKEMIDEPGLLMRKYNVIFSKAGFDFGFVGNEQLPTEISIVTIFAGTNVKVPPNIPFRVEAEGAFAMNRMPPGNLSSFGRIYYESCEFDPGRPYLTIRLSTVLGTASVSYSNNP